MVPDTLSRDDDRSEKELINILCTHCPSQLPQHFKIVPLPSKITLWLTLLLLWLPVKQQLVEKHTRTKLGRGTVTPNAANNADSATTYSSANSPDSTKSRSWAPLPGLSMKDGFLDEAMIPWLKNQSLIPSTLWLQPSKNMDARTWRKTLTITLWDFYTNNWGPIKRTTWKAWNKKPFPFASFTSISPTDWLVPTSNGQPHSSRPLLGHAFMQVFEGHKSRAATDKAALPLQHCLYQKRQNPQPFLDKAAPSRLRLSHLWKTEKTTENQIQSCSGEQKIPSYAPWKYEQWLSRECSRTKEQTRTHPSLSSFTGRN